MSRLRSSPSILLCQLLVSLHPSPYFSLQVQLLTELSVSGNLPDMGMLLADFLLHGSLDPCAYFPGYLGEPGYEYPGLEQKAGMPRTWPPIAGTAVALFISYIVIDYTVFASRSRL